MATDIDVQYFSHLNGLTLGNYWGDLIRLLDKTLVTGIDFTQITAASIDVQGDVHITLYSAHNAMLFQVVELSGFVPTSFNQKYRIEGVPNTTQLILKPKTNIVERAITVTGTGKLASLGYDIIFRDTGDVKRVYRAKDPTAQHPFIRVDETISDGVNSYTSTYAKFAMVGLLEHMDHIDDYQNPNVLQLPFNPNDPAKNWKITGTGTSVKRGWAKWYWASNYDAYQLYDESTTPANGNRNFTLSGDKDSFFLSAQTKTSNSTRQLMGCGLFDSSRENSIISNWFLMAYVRDSQADAGSYAYNMQFGTPLQNQAAPSGFLVPSFNQVNILSAHTRAIPVVATINSGKNNAGFNADFGAVQIPFYDAQGRVRGVLRHVCYAGNNITANQTSVTIQDNSMFVSDKGAGSDGASDSGGFHFYLGELDV